MPSNHFNNYTYSHNINDNFTGQTANNFEEPFDWVYMWLRQCALPFMSQENSTTSNNESDTRKTISMPIKRNTNGKETRRMHYCTMCAVFIFLHAHMRLQHLLVRLKHYNVIQTFTKLEHFHDDVS